LSHRRLFLLPVVSLLLSALASANSVPLAPSLRPGAFGGSQTHFLNASTAGRTTTQGTFSAFNNSAPHDNGTPYLNSRVAGNIVLGNATYDVTRLAFVDGRHGTIAYSPAGWAVWRKKAPSATTPEPDSLVLLSTGLIVIAGIVRRKWCGENARVTGTP
jgi:hypothetical protein